MTEQVKDQYIEDENEEIVEDDQLLESSGQEVAAKMMKSKTMKPFAAKVAKMPKVTRADLEKMLPDYVDGGEITKLFKEEFETTEDFDASQDIDAIFSGEGLSEEFKSNAKAIFEAAVLAQVEEREQALQEAYSEKLEEEIATINENIVSKVDEYLEYVVNEWIEENQLSVDSGLRAEIAEDFMTGLKSLFAEHYIDVPDEKADIVEELVAKVEALETELDKSITESKQLSDAIDAYKKELIVDEISEGLTEVQAAKLRTLAEKIEFVSEEDYTEKVSLTKKKYFSEGKEIDVPTSSKEDQYASTEESLDESYSPTMAHYVKSISRTLKK